MILQIELKPFLMSIAVSINKNKVMEEIVKFNKIRLENLPGNSVGKDRYELYKKAYSRIKVSLEKGYSLETIPLIDSIICDRLEARIAWIENHINKSLKSTKTGSLRTIGGNIRQLKQIMTDEDRTKGLDVLLLEIEKWDKVRGKAIHEMVKYYNEHKLKWDERYYEVTKVAYDGINLSQKLSNIVKQLNKIKK